ncbi:MULTISPECIES: abortive phage infection protein [unclassified Streptomyces]|uniref:abortive phage infection protein n=1 Tax=unclassified Streptomyces TaxID=2593676 RepID=UPI002367089E|nr:MULTISPECIES: abortive phage infection protein [unclassified Streptomyces]MDF3141119.1 abortive phage infection protein [Streptomyces sp. T21Q-yed]WDF37954.1 abortive phage infection protein [Streptomyces sp. T12]
MEKTKGISRARFLAGAAAVGLAGAVLPAGQAAATGREPERRGLKRKGLKHRGVVYTLGEGETPGTAWSAARMREDVRVIRDELHADTLDVTGDGVDRLTATAAEAAERGLHVWLQPTLGDVPERDILESIAECGRFAERLRRQGASVDFSVGCEFWLFVPGIVPGETVLDRVDNLLKGTVDMAQMQRRLARFTAKAAAVGRSVFHGRLSYAAAQDEEFEPVDWNLFDIVGIDYYSSHRQHADYVRELRRYLRWGKPLAITEFGTCAYVGAPEAGGMGWNIVDYTKEPNEIKGDLVRSERTQAAYMVDLLEVFESMGLYAAMAFEFVTPDAPHRPDNPRYDLDLASYAITKPIKDRPDDPASDWHWEPKKAFHALARHYRRCAQSQ